MRDQPATTPDLSASLAELSERLQDVQDIPPAQELQRWLLAAENKVDQAEAMFRKSLSWRNQRGVDFILNWKPPEVLRKYYPGGFAGFDGSGCPVWIIPYGNADMKGMLSCVSREEFMEFTLRIVETSMLLMRQKTLALGSPVYQHVFIFDLEGLSLKAATYSPNIDILKKLIAVYEANYPETLKAAYIINASKVFQLMFRIVKRMVQQNTLDKIKVFGTSDWKKPLHEAVPVDILPPQWGGTNLQGRDEVGHERTGICMGGEVPLYYQSVQQPQEIPGMGDISTLTITSRSVFTLRFTMKQECDLRWKFKTDGGDIGFSLQRRECVQHVRSMETVSAYHINMTVDGDQDREKDCSKDKDVTEIAKDKEAVKESKSVPEIQINDDTEKFGKACFKNSTKNQGECALELLEEVDEMGSFVEDRTIQAETITKVSRVPSHLELQTGVLHCEPGFTYILNFDNSHSIFKSKKLTYGVNIQKMKNEGEQNNNDTKGSGLSMEDLVHFVKDLLELEEEKKKAKDPNNKHKMSLSTKLEPESRIGNPTSVSTVEVHTK